MDLETENRIAAILLKEAAELRRQSEKEGVLAYLRQPKARGRPNSRFLTATVLGVQQANRAVEVNEMWRVRQKEQELDDRLKKKQKDESGSFRNHRDSATSSGSTSKTNAISNKHTNSSYSSSKRVTESCYPREDEGLRDEEVEEFLHSRVKRGRGAVGSRMDETGPYLPSDPDSKEQLSSSHDMRGHRVVIGPEKPSSLKSYESSSEEEIHENRRKKAKKGHSGGSSKEHSRKHKHRSKEKSRDKKRRDLKTISESRDKKKERSKS